MSGADLMQPDVVPLTRAAEPDLPAGDFLEWLANMDRALAAGGASDVPCGDCNACCRSAYFIEVKPGDVPARARIPAALLFDAPGAPAGYQTLGYDLQGRCPLLVKDQCDIYEDRPAACRTYDCRVFAATGLAEPGPEKGAVMARAGRWKFATGDAAAAAQAALTRGVQLMLEQFDALEDLLPSNATQLAMLCVRLHPVLIRLSEGSGGEEAVAEVRQAIEGLRQPSLSRPRAPSAETQIPRPPP